MVGTFVLSSLLVLTQQTDQRHAEHAPHAPKLYRFAEMHMGVPFRISVYARNEQAANKAVAAAYARIAELNRVFSDYDPKSEVSRLRELPAGRPAEVSRDLAHLLARSVEYSRETKGAFDVTVGPLVRLWRRARRRKRLPEPRLLQQALESSGYQHMKVGDRTLTLGREGMRLDFGAIAKGYACDEALRILSVHKLASALVDGGGDIAVSNPPPGRPGWTIQIEPERTGDPAPVLLLRNQAVATSGDRYRFVEIDGKRYSHIVNPRTGFGLTSRLTVTVVAKTAVAADAWASSLSVLGKEAGTRLIETQPGVEARVMDYSKPSPVSQVSSGFAALLTEPREKAEPKPDASKADSSNDRRVRH